MVNKYFELLWEKEVKELNGKVKFYVYKKNRAEILSIENDDENKVFGITFRTPPKDSTGVPHILEHSVLCGSKKYPVKEPFVELLKGSVQTFLNALTFPDKTCYPVASQNEKDFYNLIDVYLDAVFFPILSKETFAQEGWHLELKDENTPLGIKGVVYNEMKGAYSSSEHLIHEYSQQVLFPDTVYRFDSGGHPEKIPELSYEDFLNFHKTYYHPSNSKIFFYGNDDPKNRLEILHRYLKEFEFLKIDSSIKPQPYLKGPFEKTFFSPSEEKDPKSMITLNWLLSDTYDPDRNFDFELLDTLLIGMKASPLRQRLIESGLGEDLLGVGLENEIYQMYFSTGLKGVKEENLKKVETLILNTLEDLSQKGFDKSLIEAGLNLIEFSLRENNTGSLPQGLVIMFRSLCSWLYDKDPLIFLEFEEPLKRLKDRALKDKELFKRLIKTYLIENLHRFTVILKPDPKIKEEIEKREKEIIEKIMKKMTKEERRRHIEFLSKLKSWQQRPDPPELLSKIPHLTKNDLPKEEKKIPIKIEKEDNGEILFHDIFTNNIVYLDIGFDIRHIDQHLIPYLPLLSRCFLEMGTEKEDYISLNKRINAKTGGIHTMTFLSLTEESEDPVFWFFFRSKAMSDKVEDLLEILKDIFTLVKLDNKEKFKQILLEEKAKMEQSVILKGHHFAASRVRSRLNPCDWIQEQMGGINYLLFLRYLIKQVENNWDNVLSFLEILKKQIISKQDWIINITCSEKDLNSFDPFTSLLGSLPTSPRKKKKEIFMQSEEGPEAIIIPSQINFVSKGFRVYNNRLSFKGSHLVVTRYLKTTWLWTKVRMEGGAYGASCSLDRFAKLMVFTSYRDPNISKTIENFDKTSDFLYSFDINEEELDRAIVGTIGDMDRYMLPDAKGLVSMFRYLIGESDEKRQKIREEVFDTREKDFREMGEEIRENIKRAEVVVLGSETHIERAKKEGIAFKHVWNLFKES